MTPCYGCSPTFADCWLCAGECVGHRPARHHPFMFHEIGRSVAPVQTREEGKAKWGVGEILTGGGGMRENLERLIDEGDNT